MDPEMRAISYHRAHSNETLPPVNVSSLASNGGLPFSGRKFRSYAGMPPQDPVDLSLRHTLRVSISCVLGEDWRFFEIEAAALSRPFIVGQQNDPFDDISRILGTLEAELYSLHPNVSAKALKDFFSSFEVHKHLKLRAAQMLGFYAAQPGGEHRVWEALNKLRAKLEAYISEVLEGAPALSTTTKLSPDGVIAVQLKELRMSERQLADAVQMSCDTIRKVRRGKKVNPEKLQTLADFFNGKNPRRLCEVKDLQPQDLQGE